MERNFSGYECNDCGLWGDLIIEYAILNGNEKIQGSRFEEEKGKLLAMFNKGVRLREQNARLRGETFSLREATDFEDLGATILEKIVDCDDCKKIYDAMYDVASEY